MKRLLAESPPITGTLMTLLDRYLAGDREAVWDEIYDLDTIGPLTAEIDAVADETMRRVRINLDRIVARLDALGFAFHDPASRFLDPRRDTDLILDRIDSTLSSRTFNGVPGRPLARSVRAFFRHIGTVNLSGRDRSWPTPVPINPEHASPSFLSDGLIVRPADELLTSLGRIVDTWPVVPFSPDLFHKEDISGGPDYGFYCTSPSADAFVTEIEIAFVPYLRFCLEWAGFAGLRLYSNAPMAWINALKQDLLPF